MRLLDFYQCSLNNKQQYMSTRSDTCRLGLTRPLVILIVGIMGVSCLSYCVLQVMVLCFAVFFGEWCPLGLSSLSVSTPAAAGYGLSSTGGGVGTENLYMTPDCKHHSSFVLLSKT